VFIAHHKNRVATTPAPTPLPGLMHRSGRVQHAKWGVPWPGLQHGYCGRWETRGLQAQRFISLTQFLWSLGVRRVS
jgi:hypothetical protein